MGAIEKKNLGQPDEVEDYGEQGKAEAVTLGQSGFGVGNVSNVWRSTLNPGWSWMRNIKPMVPFESCPYHHREYVVTGRIRYTTTEGAVVEAGPGETLLIDPGHLAEVVGDEVCVVIDW